MPKDQAEVIETGEAGPNLRIESKAASVAGLGVRFKSACECWFGPRADVRLKACFYEERKRGEESDTSEKDVHDVARRRC